jgi:hypothetical protein
VRTARYPQMAAYKDRVNTLQSWPLSSPSPVQLARAGFFHVQCPSSAARDEGRGVAMLHHDKVWIHLILFLLLLEMVRRLDF